MLLMKSLFLVVSLIMGRIICSTVRQAYRAKHDEGLNVDVCSLVFFVLVTIMHFVAMGQQLW